MKHLVSCFAIFLVVFGANAAENSRVSVGGAHIMAAPRYTASINQLNGMVAANKGSSVETINATTVVTAEEKKVNTREAERNACISNNIGVGNTFVWASRYSNTSNYANMVEDVENPENNVCFVKVDLKSDNDSRVSVADIPSKYFMWGETIECGSWVGKDVMEKRILDARKGARIGGIVASTVGGAGLGVGSMELFGNKLIGGKVEGQKSLSETELYRSQLLVLQKDSPYQFERYRENLKAIKTACDKKVLTDEECRKYKPLYDEFAK